jgi:hypothetical protein
MLLAALKGAVAKKLDVFVCLLTDPAEAYHKHVVQLGLLQVVPQLAALCPDADKRTALVAAHKQYLQTAHDGLQAPIGKNARNWVPPEAAMAALAEVEAKGSWGCERCTLINAPSSRTCEVCSAPRPKAAAAVGAGSSARATGAAASASWSVAAVAGSSSSSTAGSSRAAQKQPEQQQQQQKQPVVHQQSPPADSWPGLPGGQKGKGSKQAAVQLQEQQQAASSSGASSAANEPPQLGKKKKGSKQPLSELLAAGKTDPQNAWSQQQRLSNLVAPSGGRGSMGQWGKQGGSKLAKSINAFNDAWGAKK